MAIKLLSSSVKLNPKEVEGKSAEATEMALAVSYIMAQTQGEEEVMKKALSLAEVYAKEHGMDVRALQMAFAVQFTRNLVAESLPRHRKISAETDIRLAEIAARSRQADALLIASRARFNEEELALIRAELAQEKRKENSTEVPKKDIRVIRSSH